MTKPERFAVLTLNLQADSVAELRHRLREIENELGECEPDGHKTIRRGDGSYSSFARLDINPHQTNDRYHQELSEFLRDSKQGEAKPLQSFTYDTEPDYD